MLIELEVEMLWVDKYRPKTLDKVLVHEEIAQNLKKLVIVDQIDPTRSHFMF